MRWSPQSHTERTNTSLDFIEERDTPNAGPVEVLSRQTNEAMDGFEEWLKQFKEELAQRGWPADR